MVSLLQKANNAMNTGFNQPGVMDLMTKSFFPLRFVCEEERRMQNAISLGGARVCAAAVLLFTVISLHLMISDRDQPFAVNSQQMRRITMCERGSLARCSPTGVMSLGSGVEK